MDSTTRYEQQHTPDGAFIAIGTTQDAEGDHCRTCGRTVEHPHNHAFDCPSFGPHPASIAATEAGGSGASAVPAYRTNDEES